jgi:multiple sugar transport system substrate-binding protein
MSKQTALFILLFLSVLVACTPTRGQEITAEIITPPLATLAMDGSAETAPINPQRPTTTPASPPLVDEEPLPVTVIAEFPDVPTAEPLSDVTLTWWGNPYIGDVDFYQALTAELDAQHPNFNLDYRDEIDADHYAIVVQTMLVAGDGPDVFWVSGNDLAEFVEWNSLLDLRPYAAGFGLTDTEQFYPGPLRHLTFDPVSGEQGTRLWALPSELDTMGIYLNLDLLSAAGAPDPRQLAAAGNWNWNTFLEVAQAVNNPQSTIYGYEQPYSWWGFGMWANAAGGSLIQPDGTCGLTTAESLTGFTFAHQLFQEAKVTPPAGTRDSLFTQGQVGMALFTRSMAPYLQEAPFQWDVVELPAGPVSSGNYIFWGSYAVNAYTEHPEEAWQLVQALVSAETQTKLVATGRMMPSRIDRVELFLATAGPGNQAFLNGLSGATAIPPRWTGGLTYDDFSCSAVNHLLSGQITLDDFAANACNQFTQASITVCP